MFLLSVHLIYLTVRKALKVFFGEIDPDLLSYGPAFLKVAWHQV